MTGSKAVIAKLIGGKEREQNWQLAEESPVALRIGGETYAVMLALPLDLVDFARGFCLSEGLVSSNEQIISIKAREIKHGYEVDIILTNTALKAFSNNERRRRLAGSSGCGVCGLTSLKHIVEPLPKIESTLTVTLSAIQQAYAKLNNSTPINMDNKSVHAMAFVDTTGEILFVREDVGRHNALDKLFGAVIAAGLSFDKGFILLTSRFAYELAQKCIRLGVPMVVSISAPTTMAVNMAKAAEMTLLAYDQDNQFMCFNGHKNIIEL